MCSETFEHKELFSPYKKNSLLQSTMSTTPLAPIKCDVPSVNTLCKDMGDSLQETVASYSSRFADSQDTHSGVDKETVAKKRVENARNLTQSFYSIVTDFYEYGYGCSFHFAPVLDELSFEQSLQEYEHSVAKSLQAKAGMKLLDIGCGVGGPGREIARFSGADVVGLNYSDYQIKKAKEHTRKANLDQQCTYVKGDFCSMEFEDSTFDGAFALEATCHAKDPLDVYSEAFRALKPGGIYVDATWAMTDTYDPNNPQHEKIKNDIMFGNSLPEIRTKQELLSCMRKAGFEVVQVRNAEREGDRPWYHYLVGNGCCSLQAFRVSGFGRRLTHMSLTVMEALSMVPVGTTQVHSMLLVGAFGLIESGKLDIFSPMYIMVARKPVTE